MLSCAPDLSLLHFMLIRPSFLMMRAGMKGHCLRRVFAVVLALLLTGCIVVESSFAQQNRRVSQATSTADARPPEMIEPLSRGGKSCSHGRQHEALLGHQMNQPWSSSLRHLVQIAECQQSATAILGPECLSGNERVEWWSEGGDQIVRVAAG